MKPQSPTSQPSPTLSQKAKAAVKWDLCGHSPSGGILNWMASGATKGAIGGAIAGADGLGVPTAGLGAIPGAIVGGVVGGVAGAGAGVLLGAAATFVCSNTGAYGPP